MTTLLGLDVTGRPVLVAGGGPVAARRAGALAADGALVTVVAPQLCEDLRDLVTSGVAAWAEREVAETDLDGTWLVHAATDDSEVNAALCAWASARRVWSVNAGDGARGTARTPATTVHAGLAVGVVSTGRPDPARVAAVRDALDLTLASGRVDLRARRPGGDDGAGGGVRLLTGRT
ncbi:MAG TPA: NAD(P)-dependent oxidoreductase [Oryzihumus sp.]|nr:NAD(P)-dependent oxidoreductase [Oryzihumus sp.]